METLQRTANRGSVSTADYSIDNSVLLVGANCEGEITQTAGDRKTHTISFWHKRAPIGPGSGAGELDGAGEDLWGTPSEGDTLRFGSSDLAFFHEGGTGSSLVTDRKFRDCSAWYHFVVAIDTTQAVAANRIKIYVNGVQETSFSTETYPDEDDEFKLMENSQVFRIGAGHGGTTSATGQGYNADFIIVDGAAKAASDFGEFDSTSGIWKPKEYTGDFNTGSGTNGAHYKFAGAAEGTGAGSTGLDSSGESNNMNFENQVGGLTDTPTNNFCTLNPLDRTISATYDGQLVRGMLEYQPESGTSVIRGTMGVTKGKWYWEAKLATTAGQSLGVCTANMDIPLTSTQEGGWIGASVQGDAHVFSLYANSAYRSYFFYDGSNSNSAVSFASGTFTYNDIFGFAFDADNLDIYISKKGSWTDVKASQDPEGDPGSNTAHVYHASFNNDENEPWLPIVSNTYNQDMTLNFGNPVHAITSGNADANGYGNFEYAVPSGYYALCTKNIAEFG